MELHLQQFYLLFLELYKFDPLYLFLGWCISLQLEQVIKRYPETNGKLRPIAYSRLCQSFDFADSYTRLKEK